MKPPIGRDTRMCMSLAGRPGNFGSRFHNHLYEQLGLDYIYKAFTANDLPAAINGIRALGIRGCAISMPFKEAVIPLIDVLEVSARAIDSVNTILNEDGHLTGYNTDYIAVKAIVAAAGIASATPFILRGSGGMAKAVAAALYDAGFRSGTLVARNESAGRALAEKYGYVWRDRSPGGAPFLINVTPIGMAGAHASELSFPASQIDACSYAFDVVALPEETPFLAHARSRDKQLISGADILVLQALEQFVLYTGVRPTPSQVAAAVAFAR